MELGDIELVEARKDDLRDLLLRIALGNPVTAQNHQPAFARPHLFPQVRRTVPTTRVDRVARRAVVAQVEGQEHGSRPGQLGDHVCRLTAAP